MSGFGAKRTYMVVWARPLRSRMTHNGPQAPRNPAVRQVSRTREVWYLPVGSTGDVAIEKARLHRAARRVAAWPLALAARAQQPAKVPIIGFLGPGTPSAWSAWIAAFVQRLRELGWIEGRTLAIEYRWAEGSPSASARLPLSSSDSRSM